MKKIILALALLPAMSFAVAPAPKYVPVKIYNKTNTLVHITYSPLDAESPNSLKNLQTAEILPRSYTIVQMPLTPNTGYYHAIDVVSAWAMADETANNGRVRTGTKLQSVFVPGLCEVEDVGTGLVLERPSQNDNSLTCTLVTTSIA